MYYCQRIFSDMDTRGGKWSTANERGVVVQHVKPLAGGRVLDGMQNSTRLTVVLPTQPRFVLETEDVEVNMLGM